MFKHNVKLKIIELEINNGNKNLFYNNQKKIKLNLNIKLLINQKNNFMMLYIRKKLYKKLINV